MVRQSSACSAEVRPGEKSPKCAACPFAIDGQPQHPPVRPTIPKRRDLVGVLIGESPGRDEVSAQEPFVGATGEELNLLLGEVGLERHQLLVINAMGCKPPDGMKTAANMRKAAQACRPWMRSILKKVTPLGTPTLAMGKWAGFLATGLARGIGDRRGFLRYEHRRYRPLILTWHPTFALFYNAWEAGNFFADLDRFARSIRGELQPVVTELIIKPTLKQIKSLWEEPFITVDIETGQARKDQPWTGKDPTQAKMKVLGLGTPEKAYSMWWPKTDNMIKLEVRRLMRSRSIIKVGQNFWWFDKRVMARFGFKKIRNIKDTRDIRRALVSTSRLSLGYMASVYLDVQDWKAKGEDDGKE